MTIPFFIGAIITHSPNHKDNILILKAHFNEVDQKGAKFKLYFDNTNLVEAKLLKDWNGGPSLGLENFRSPASPSSKKR
jgi:hypothetical protein